MASCVMFFDSDEPVWIPALELKVSFIIFSLGGTVECSDLLLFKLISTVATRSAVDAILADACICDVVHQLSRTKALRISPHGTLGAFPRGAIC